MKKLAYPEYADDLKLLKQHEEKIASLGAQVLTQERIEQIIRECKPGTFRISPCFYVRIPYGKMRAYWAFIYSIGGVRKTMTLGSTRHTTLAEAKKIIDSFRRMRLAGLDPRVERDKLRQEGVKFTKQHDSFRAFTNANKIIRAMGVRHV